MTQYRPTGDSEIIRLDKNASPTALLRQPDGRSWSPARAYAAAWHAVAVYHAPAHYHLNALRAGWEGGTVIEEKNVEIGIAWSPYCVVITPRGSDTRTDWLWNLRSIIRVGWKDILPKGASVGRGFKRAAEIAAPRLIEWMKHLYGRPWGWPSIVFTGHSLGAAIVPLLLSHLEQHAYASPTEAWCFSSPRVGNEQWAEWYNWRYDSDIARTWNVVATSHGSTDLITRVPKLAWGFRDVGYRVTLHDDSVFLGQPAWEAHRKAHPVGHLQAWRLLGRFSSALRAHDAGRLLATLATMPDVRLELPRQDPHTPA